VAYPFIKYPSFAEFREILEKEFDCKFRQLDGVLVDPDGNEHEVRYFQRQVSKRLLLCPIDLSDDTILTPSVLRSTCARLKIPVQRFGLVLG
jgi:hypothetical protein